MRPAFAWGAALPLLLAPALLQGQAKVAAGIPTAAPVKVDAGATKPSRESIRSVETLFDTRLGALGTANEPVEMLVHPLGLYLTNYGAVFSSELFLMVTPTTNPFRPTITKEFAEQVHDKKLARMPALRAAILATLKDAANNLPQVPDRQQFVIAVRLDYYSWENRKGLPGQIVAMADRKGALSGDVQVTEEQ